MSDYRDYKVVKEAKDFGKHGHHWRLRLECWHVVFRRTKYAPSAVLCEVCEYIESLKDNQ